MRSSTDSPPSPNRREFLTTLGRAGVGLAFAPTALAQGPPASPRKKIKLGLDNFAVRAMNWKAAALIDYAAALKLDSLLISDLDALESLQPEYLRAIRNKAGSHGPRV